MLRMMNAARASERLPALARDAALAALARAHSEEMIKAKMVGHDVGSGDPAARLQGGRVRGDDRGENVASSGTTEGAHRAIWASPSRRGQPARPALPEDRRGGRARPDRPGLGDAAVRRVNADAAALR